MDTILLFEDRLQVLRLFVTIVCNLLSVVAQLPKYVNPPQVHSLVVLTQPTG